MTRIDIRSFLKVGAVLRASSNKVLVWQGPFESALEANNRIFSIGYASFFDGKVTYKRSAQAPVEMEVGELRRALRAEVETPSTFRRNLFENPPMELFQNSYQQVLGKIHRGEIEKAVPIVFARAAQAPDIKDRACLLDRALEAHSELFVYGYWTENDGILGATPETLFDFSPGSLTSMALAGTYSRSVEHARTQILKDPKERHEHQLVINDIKERLGSFGFVQIGETHSVEFPTLVHLRTRVQIDSPSGTVDDYFKALHPTPALGVAPRNYGTGWMKDLPDQKDRGLFGAPLLFSLPENRVVALVAIRNLIWQNGTSKIGTGCGLVQASDMLKEWNELTTKRESIFQTLGL